MCRASYANPEIGDGAERFNNDFGNTAIAPKVTRKKTQGSLRWPADHIRDDAIREKKIYQTDTPPLYQQYRDQRCVE
jgi:hypothetical protein